MQKLILIIVLTFTSILNAQSNFEKGMQKAFEFWQSGKSIEASNLFERIANAEKENWLPFYYAAQVNIMESFGEKDKKVLTSKLKKAQDFINEATTLSQNNPEVLVLQALLHTAWVAYDSAIYGMQLSGKVMALYEKAKVIAPNNPRVVYCKADWDIGGAKFFGKDTKPFCKELERALDLFTNFKPESEFHPNWGKERVEELLKDCK